jgi:hypothetical protein
MENFNLIFGEAYNGYLTVFTRSHEIDVTSPALVPVLVPFVYVNPSYTADISGLPSNLTSTVSLFYFPGTYALGKKLSYHAKAIVGSSNQSATQILLTVSGTIPASATPTVTETGYTVNPSVPASSGTSITVNLVDFVSGATIASGTLSLAGLLVNQPQVLDLLPTGFALPKCPTILAVTATATIGTTGVLLADNPYIAYFSLYTIREQ